MIKRIALGIMGLVFTSTVTLAKKEPVPVFIVAGQSNTDGRVPIEDFPSYITPDNYHYCHWSYGSGEHSGDGKFEQFWPHTYFDKCPEAWAYDAITYYLLGQSLQQDFYVIKESLGGTAISPNARKSTNGMFWCAGEGWLAKNEATDKGGKSLTKAFVNNIDACIDQQLSKIKQGYDIKAFLWHQGESDASMAGSYKKNLKTVIDYVRRHLVEKTGNEKYAQLPVIIGSIPHASKDYQSKIETAQMQLTDEDTNISLIDIHDAPLLSDHLHLNAEGAELLGRKVYNKLVELGLAGKTAKAVTFHQKSRHFKLSEDDHAYLVGYFPEHPNGKAVVACPGGGYDHLAIKVEGTDWSGFYNKQGITYFVLKYRMPNGDSAIPVSDAEAAIKMVRDSAKVWGINPQQVGIMGSSAGGHLASTVATHAEKAVCPDFQILFYPVITFGEGCHKGSRKNLLGKDEQNKEQQSLYSNEQQVRKGKTPPAIIFLADDDNSVPPATNGMAYYEALQREGISSELHAYPKGGHGFGFKKFAHHDEMLTTLCTWLQRL